MACRLKTWGVEGETDFHVCKAVAVAVAEGGDADFDPGVAAVADVAAVVDLAGQQWFHQQTGPQCGMCGESVLGAKSTFVADGWDSAVG